MSDYSDLYYETLDNLECIRADLEQAEAINARWQAVVRAVGKLAYNHDSPENIIPFLEVCEAMRTGTLEDIEKKLGIEVKS